MDNFENAGAPKGVQAEKSASGGNRWLWAASMGSIIGLASVSYVLVTDHMRISALQEKIANRHLS